MLRIISFFACLLLTIIFGCSSMPKGSAVSDSKGQPTRRIDKIDYPFVDDAQVIGKWKSVDFVETIDDFNPDEKKWNGDLYLKELIILEGGKTFKPWWNWTKGIITHSENKTASKYVIKEIKGSNYMFFEWKSGDYVLRNMTPWFYVLKKEVETEKKQQITVEQSEGDKLEQELERRRNLIINITPEEKINLDNYVGTWKTCAFSEGIGTDKWIGLLFENSTLRYLQFFPNGDLWVTGDWTRQEGWPFNERNVATIKTLHSWDGTDMVHLYGKVDHPEKRDFRLIKQDDKLYFLWLEDTYYVLEKVSDNPEIKVIK